MAISKQDVLHALLALDAYNRHIQPEFRNLSEGDDSELSAQIGNVTFEKSSDRMEKDGVTQLPFAFQFV